MIRGWVSNKEVFANICIPGCGRWCTCYDLFLGTLWEAMHLMSDWWHNYGIIKFPNGQETWPIFLDQASSNLGRPRSDPPTLQDQVTSKWRIQILSAFQIMSTEGEERRTQWGILPLNLQIHTSITLLPIRQCRMNKKGWHKTIFSCRLPNRTNRLRG